MLSSKYLSTFLSSKGSTLAAFRHKIAFMKWTCTEQSHAASIITWRAIERDICHSRKFSLLTRHVPKQPALLPLYCELPRSVLGLILIDITHQGLFTAVILGFISGVGVLLIHPYLIAKWCPHDCILPLVFPVSYWLAGLFPGLAIVKRTATIIIKDTCMNTVIPLLMSKCLGLLACRVVLKRNCHSFSQCGCSVP